jgi:membrane protein DedA with SNARE-associated domain
MLDQLLAALTQYGSPALFVVVAIAAIGVPVPVTLLLIVTGSLAAQGSINLWWAIAIASVGSVAGDQIGFAIGRWGGKKLVAKFSRMLGDAERIKKLDAKAKSWGGAGVFFSRWLVTPLGPWINLASGAADYSWFQFTLWDILGESFGAGLFIWLGNVFSDRVQEVGAIFGDLTWAIVGVLAAAFLGWKLFFNRGTTKKKASPIPTA